MVLPLFAGNSKRIPHAISVIAVQSSNWSLLLRAFRHNQFNFNIFISSKAKCCSSSVCDSCGWHIQPNWTRIWLHAHVCMFLFHLHFHLNVFYYRKAHTRTHHVFGNVCCYYTVSHIRLECQKVLPPKSLNSSNKKGINQNGVDFTIIGQYNWSDGGHVKMVAISDAHTHTYTNHLFTQ